MKYYEDPILGKGRAADVTGGTGGGSDYTFNISEFTVSIAGLVSIKTIDVSKITGAVTGIDASVSGGTATIVATGSTTSVKFTGKSGVDVSGNTNGEVELDAKDLSDGTQSITKDLTEARYVEPNPIETASTQNALTLLHFSDIHADTATLGRIIADATALAPNVDAMLCTGDVVLSYAGDGYRDNVVVPALVGEKSISDFWNTNVMIAVGNHDCCTSSTGTWTDMSMATRSSVYIEPFESTWGVTHTAGTSYYYKDFSTQKVRLIVLDCLLYLANPVGTTQAEAEAQTSWLSSLLDDAITNNLHVLIAAHSPYWAFPVQCSFSKYNQGYRTPGLGITQSIVSLVATKIQSGLHFAGYLCGHAHQDGVWDEAGDGTQYAYDITCAAINPAGLWSMYSDQHREPGIDAYNLVTIDTTNTLLKIVRGGGANIDNRMRKREQICVNYATGEIMDYESEPEYFPVYTPTGSTVGLEPGKAYKFNVTSSVTLAAPEMPDNYIGQSGMLDVTLSGGTVLSAGDVVFLDSFTDDMRHICSVSYVDGVAYVSVITVLSLIPADAYTVSVSTGTSDGSIYYGLATSDKTEIYASPSVNYQTLDLGGAVTNGVKNIYGNGFQKTIVSGGVSCTSTTTFTDVSLSGASVTGGTMTLTNICIPLGGTVGTAGGELAIGNIAGSGGVLDLTSHNVSVPNRDTVSVSGVTVRCGTATSGGGICNSRGTTSATNCIFFGGSATNGGLLSTHDGKIVASGCVFSGGTASYGGAIHNNAGNISATDCVFSANKATGRGGAVYAAGYGSTVCNVFSNCVFDGNTADLETYGRAMGVVKQTDITGCTFTSGQSIILFNGAIVNLYGSNTIFSIKNAAGNASTGKAQIHSGATVNLTGISAATPINPGGGVVVEAGGCQVITSAGSTVSIAGGTYTQINNDGTTN